MAIFKRNNRGQQKKKGAASPQALMMETELQNQQVSEVSDEAQLQEDLTPEEQFAEQLLTAAAEGRFVLPEDADIKEVLAEAENGEQIKPVLAYGTENETPAKEEEVEDVVDSIAGIFGSSDSAAAKPAAIDLASEHPVTPAQSRWFDRRRKAMEQARRENEALLEAAAEEQTDEQSVQEMPEVPVTVGPIVPKANKQKKKKPREMRSRTGAPVSLAFADLSDQDDLEPYEIEEATDIYGIKYPADFDTSRVNYNGRAIDLSDFSLVSGLRWEHIEGASDISGIIFPSTFDIDNAEFYGRSLRGCDFSAVYSLKWKHIEAAENIAAIKYPATFDIANAKFFARNISGSDFSLVSGLEWEHIWDAADITGIKYPAGFDVSAAELEGRDISGSNFSLVENLRWEDIKSAGNIEGIIYPAGFDFEQADFAGRSVKGSDYTRAAVFPFASIKNAIDIRRLKYPECFDSNTADFSGRTIAGSNFSRVSTLRFAHIKDATDITGVVYPPQFDIENADFTGRDIDDSDFSLLPDFNWQSVHFAESRENIVLPASVEKPRPTDEEIEGAMLIFLLKLYNREYRSELDVARFNEDISALYPGVDDVMAAELIEAATAIWEKPDGQREIEIMAREAYTGDKLFMTKLGFKLLYPRRGAEAAVKLLREQFEGIFNKSEKERFERRLSDLQKGKCLSAAEIAAIGFEPIVQTKTERSVAVAEPEVDENGYTAEELAELALLEAEIQAEEAQKALEEAQKAEAAKEESENRENPEALPADNSRVYTFGQVSADAIGEISDTTPFVVPDEPVEVVKPENEDIFKPAATSETLSKKQETKPVEKAEEKPAQPASQPEKAAAADRLANPVDLSKLRQQRAAQRAAATAYQRREKLSDEEKAIRTGVMGMLLYIHQNTSEQELSNSELYAEFMKIYPGSAPKEAAAMAQFATNTLGGTDAEMRAKLFMFASRASGAVKRKLLDFAYNEYIYRLSETADEEIFRDFLMALCDTLYEDSPDYEFSSYLRSKDILKNPPIRREASYRRIPFENNIGKANLYANERYPYYRTLEQVGFQHFSFDAIRGNLLIEVSDSRYYEDIDSLVYREKEPNLLQFVVIETQMGYLYLEQRCIADWKVDERDVWAAAEHNMSLVDMKPKYSFASSEFSSFRYIQHDLASYLLCKPELMDEIAGGQDLILALPCREIVYIDFYDFAAIKRMIEFNSRYNCTLIIGGDEYEHPFSTDVFIYHAESGRFERVNDETYILLGDSVARRQVLRSVLPLNIEFSEDMLTKPLTTDETPMVNDEQCVVQEAAFTLLRLYAEMNGERDYTVAQNAFMAIVDEVFISFDAIYPPPRGREQPDPMEHLEEAARMVIKGGKKLCWLLIQAMQHICGDIKYETPTSARIRETVLCEIYGENANAVWLNCATAADFAKRLEATKNFHEIPVENNHLTILDSKVEVAMHVMTMIFHQFANRYALGEVRRHLNRALPGLRFTYEINQSAWLPSPGEDIDVDAQSLGMIFRGFDRSTQERMLTAFADAIGDRDLSEGGWPLLYFIKFVKYSYLDPVEMVERYFMRRSRLIPSHTVLKQLYYKDLNNEFVKHARRASRIDGTGADDAFEERSADEMLIRSVESFDNAMAFEATPGIDTLQSSIREQEETLTFQRPDIQLAPVEAGYLEKKLSFVLEEVNPQTSGALREAAHYVTKVFHVPEVMFKANDDIECELHYGIIRSRDQVTALRSFAWTLSVMMEESRREMRDITENDVLRAVEILEENNRLNYKPKTKHFTTLCSMPLDEGMYIPSHQEYIFFAKDLLPEVEIASLFTLQDELMELAPAMKLTYDILREQKRGEIMPPRGVLFDVLCAWSAYCFAASDAFEVVKGPQMYNYNQIVR